MKNRQKSVFLVWIMTSINARSIVFALYEEKLVRGKEHVENKFYKCAVECDKLTDKYIIWEKK